MGYMELDKRHMQTFVQKSFFFAVFYQINMSKNIAFSKWVAEDRTASSKATIND